MPPLKAEDFTRHRQGFRNSLRQASPGAVKAAPEFPKKAGPNRFGPAFLKCGTGRALRNPDAPDFRPFGSNRKSRKFRRRKLDVEAKVLLSLQKIPETNNHTHEQTDHPRFRRFRPLHGPGTGRIGLPEGSQEQIDLFADATLDHQWIPWIPNRPGPAPTRQPSPTAI